jgi:hypothetical protein
MSIWLWSFKETMVVRFLGGFDYVFKLRKYYLGGVRRSEVDYVSRLQTAQ